jgi:C4-dicarboxylate transporter, DctQ subunit
MSDNRNTQNVFLNRLSDSIVLLSGLAILAITLLISFDVLMRYFLDQPQLFVDEMTSFLLVFVIFLGTGPTFWKGGHIQVDLVISRLRYKTRSRLRILTLFIGLILLSIITYETLVSTLVAFRLGRVSAVMLYPLWIAMFFVPFGLILMAFFMAVNLIKEMRGKEAEERRAEISP